MGRTQPKSNPCQGQRTMAPDGEADDTGEAMT
jgi:hypothetical protein